MYNAVSQLGLNNACTTDQLIIALQQNTGKQILCFAAFRSDYPNLRFGGTGKKHVYTIKYLLNGYVSITDDDISNGITYYCGHDGTNYSTWTSIDDLNELKKVDFVITKYVPSIKLQVNENTFSKIFKNAVAGGADYGTSIKDYTNGVQTELKIQNGKMWLDGKEVVTK